MPTYRQAGKISQNFRKVMLQAKKWMMPLPQTKKNAPHELH
jgi:hypothetical protein